MKKVVDLLNKLNYTLSSCESVTGGLFSKSITDIPGAAQVFKGGIVSYTNEVKINVVHIKKDIIKKYGAVSPECALAMAQNIREIFKTDVAVSFTGNAGPDSSENKPVGLVYLALVTKNDSLVEELTLNGSRETIRNEMIKQVETILIKNLIKIKKESSK